MREFSRLAFVLSVSAAVLVVAFGAGLYSGVKKNAVFRAILNVKESIELVISERENLVPGGTPIHFLQPARFAGSGVTINERPNDGGMVMIAGFFDDNNEVRLIRRDGEIVARWPVRFSDHFPGPTHLRMPPQTDHNIDTHGALVLPDGSVVFNYDYGGTVKLSRCGEVIWTLAHPTHHSVERSEKGGFWIPGREYLYEADFGKFPPITRPGGVFFMDDLILKVSEDGSIESSKSVVEMLYENDLEALLTAVGHSFSANTPIDAELTHVNKIEELPAASAEAFPTLDAGDLVLSFRNYNLLLIVDPDDWTVKWHQTGPWLRQHDPEFDDDGTIVIFNNNTYELSHDSTGRISLDTPRVSNIYRVNPATGEGAVVFGEQPGEEFLSVVRGKHEIMAGGGFMVTEFQGGRVFETDANRRIVWEFINGYDEDEVQEVTEARLYPAGYFQVEDWSCP